MPAERFERLRSLFDAALERGEDTRESFVRETCDEDVALAEEALALLYYEAKAAVMQTAKPFDLAAEALDAVEGSFLRGRIVGRYRLESEIAAGGMGRVFKARRVDGDVEQTVAIKLIRRELFDEALLERFSSERRILASLNHPGIAHLIDAGADAHGAPFVAMEYVDGLPLLDYCAEHRLSVRERLELFRQLLDAVAYAHRNLVVHRDIKPENVRVTFDGRTKLLDFGIAKTLSLDMKRTQTALRFFTPAYAAPELLLGRNAAVACDVYGLGAILYALLTGGPPIDLSAVSAGEAERMILKTPPMPLRMAANRRGGAALAAQGIVNSKRWASQLDGDLDHIVQKALRKEPQARYVGVDAFDQDILRFLSRRPVAARGVDRLYRIRKFCERNALALSFAAVLLVAGAITVWQSVRQNYAIRQERDRARAALGILRESFVSADPMRPDAADLRARDILASAASRVSHLESQQPQLFRELAYEIGEVQLNLGMSGAAMNLLGRANRSKLGPTDAGLLLEIRALIAAGHLDQAQATIKRARARLSDDPGYQAERAHLSYLRGGYREAAGLCERLLSDGRTASMPLLRDRVYWYLAETYRLSERDERAVSVIDKQIAEQRKRYGRDHPAISLSRLRRAEILSEIGEYASSERELESIEPLIGRYFDSDSSVQAHYHNVFGSVLNGQQRPEEALVHFRLALSANQAALGPDHENTARAHFNVAQVISYGRAERSEAYPHFAEAIDAIERSEGVSYPAAGFFRLEAAKSLYWDKNAEAARHMLTPEHAPRYFPRMPEATRKEYLAALYFGFGPQQCRLGWERQLAAQPQSLRVARMLMCRYDPAGENRPVD